jgi:serine/threonine protein kinase
MEYFELGDLRQCLSQQEGPGTLPENEVKDIVFQLASGLSFMHDNGYAHRDLKPQVSSYT